MKVAASLPPMVSGGAPEAEMADRAVLERLLHPSANPSHRARAEIGEEVVAGPDAARAEELHEGPLRRPGGGR